MPHRSRCSPTHILPGLKTPAAPQRWDEELNSPFRDLHHICIVVRDMEESVRYYTSLGIGPWRDFANPTALAEVSMPNREAFFALTYKCADLGGVQLQLCQPPQLDCPQRRFLDTRGEGVFHLGFSVEDVDRGEEAGQELGLEVLMSGRRSDRSGFTYFDTQDDAGFALSVRSAPPPASR
ncbi:MULTISPECIES: VOC family protein [unclassified Streptomyces]|uniref:VOC family protein n=1 Tax=unclassified Streptomyces TaxID=2593676 RepID=UPI0037F72753